MTKDAWMVSAKSSSSGSRSSYRNIRQLPDVASVEPKPSSNVVSCHNAWRIVTHRVRDTFTPWPWRGRQIASCSGAFPASHPASEMTIEAVSSFAEDDESENNEDLGDALSCHNDSFLPRVGGKVVSFLPKVGSKMDTLRQGIFTSVVLDTLDLSQEECDSNGRETVNTGPRLALPAEIDALEIGDPLMNPPDEDATRVTMVSAANRSQQEVALRARGRRSQHQKVRGCDPVPVRSLEAYLSKMYSNEPSALQLVDSTSRNDVEAVRQLLAAGADANSRVKRVRITSAMHEASRLGHFRLLRLLLQSKGDANLLNASFRTPLHSAQTVETARLLLQHGAEVSPSDPRSPSVLDCPHLQNKPDLARLLLDWHLQQQPLPAPPQAESVHPPKTIFPPLTAVQLASVMRCWRCPNQPSSVSAKFSKGGKADFEEECAICLLPLIEGEVISLPCGPHVLHLDCLLPWLRQRCLCPVCRCDLRPMLRLIAEATGTPAKQNLICRQSSAASGPLQTRLPVPHEDSIHGVKSLLDAFVGADGAMSSSPSSSHFVLPPRMHC